MRAALGLARSWLDSGDIASARRETEGLLQSALSTADPNMQALAWEIKIRVALAEKDETAAKKSMEAALAVLQKQEVPMSAWRVHAAAWEFYEHRKNHEEAESHRARAEEGIHRLADSFAEEEPLRAIFLAAGPVRRILSAASAGTVSLGRS
jgi:hypothetical protein